MTPANYNAFPALQLFKERARAVVPGFKLTHENAADVARICAWLDGLPLAIEMTAAHLRRYDLPTILTRLSDQLSILTGGPRDLSPRQQSMEGAIAWSYEMLDPQLQAIFAALSVLVGSYDSAAAQAIADPHGLFGREAFEDQLYRLVEKSLLRHVVASDGSHRYSMLVVMREFAFARLTEQGRVAEVQQRHAAHYSNVLEQARPFVKGGREQAVWLPRLEREYDNLRVALDWITGRPEHATLVLKMVVTLFPVWNTRGYYNEGRNWLERALSLGGAPEWRAKCLDCIGWIARMQGDPVAAQTALEEALALHTETGDEPGMATSLSHLAVLAGSEGDYQQAGALLIKALEIRRRVDEPVNLGPTLNNLGVVYLRTGEYEQAERCYRESEEICRAYGYETSLTHSLHGLAKVYRFQKRFGEAYELLKQVVTTRYKLNYRFELLTSLREVGELLFELGDHKQAARLAAAVDRWTTELGFQLQANAKAENAIHFAILRNTLGEAAFTNTWAEGVGLSIDEAVALAIKNEGVQGQVATRHYTP
jgi:tetratricopeptide (TPR) repeat protein